LTGYRVVIWLYVQFGADGAVCFQLVGAGAEWIGSYEQYAAEYGGEQAAFVHEGIIADY
jgi:hypothetical protein